MSGFLDFVRYPVLETPENTTFRRLDLFPSSGERWETHILLGPLERADLNRPVIYVSSLYRTQQSTCLPPLTLLRKEIQFPVRRVL
jgi:hypothetical protein